MSQPIRLNPANLPTTEELGYSQISMTSGGRLAFVSGQVAMSGSAGASVPPGIVEQTELVLRNLSYALHALEVAPHDIVQLRIYAIDMSQTAIADLMKRVGGFLQGARPSLTGIGVSALASPDFLIEIEMVVQLRGE